MVRGWHAHTDVHAQCAQCRRLGFQLGVWGGAEAGMLAPRARLTGIGKSLCRHRVS